MVRLDLNSGLENDVRSVIKNGKLDNLETDRTITSIKIMQQSWGCISFDEISKSLFKISKTGKIVVSFFNSDLKKPIKTSEYKVSKNNVKEFFTKLITDVKILEWNDDYSVPVCDGYHWDVIIRFSDKSIKRVQGTVEGPTNGKLLEEMIYELAKYEKDPWLF